uniref:Uncharacterized protein n=1 Tax=Lepeophtheirus salmonis TaxID=72036 RepID=A0A0K2TSB7_LEPSM
MADISPDQKNRVLNVPKNN